MPEEFDVDLLTPHLNGQPHATGWTTHMRRSGYEAIVNYLGKSNVYYVPDFPKLIKLSYPLRVTRLLSKSYLSLHAEQAALKGKGRLLHHLYGENTLWLSLLGHHRRPIVATFHRPPRLLNAEMPLFWKQAIHNLAGVVVLSPTLLSYMKSSCSLMGTHIALIPHGIDTEYFSPSEDERSNELAISVGSYLRDPATLIRAMRIVREKAPRLKLILVSKAPTSGPDNVIVKHGITDEELLGYYRRSSFMILPLVDLVASNAMLEAMACGVPVICPNFQSARFYMGNVPTTYDPGNANDLADKIIWLYENDDERRKLGSEMRERAQTFSWIRISSMMRSFYETILNC
jgi:glycosyltransferase involved in cell wall biosynthesis